MLKILSLLKILAFLYSVAVLKQGVAKYAHILHLCTLIKHSGRLLRCFRAYFVNFYTNFLKAMSGHFGHCLLSNAHLVINF